MIRTENLFTKFVTGLALFGGLGFALAVLASCVSAVGKGLARLFNLIFGPQHVPDYLNWIQPISGEDEIVAFAMGFALFAAAPFVMIKGGHVTVDLFKTFFSDRLNRLLDFLGNLAFACLAWLIFAQQWNLIFKPARKSRGQSPLLELVLNGDWTTIAKRFQNKKETQVLALEYWPLHLWAEFCIGVFFVTASFCALRSFLTLRDATRV